MNSIGRKLRLAYLTAGLALFVSFALAIELSPMVLAKGSGGHNGGGDGGAGGTGADHASRSQADSSRNAAAGAAALGSLNAAHASEQALAHASPTSVPGKLALYQAGVEEEQKLETQIAELEAAIAELDPASADYSTTSAGDADQLQQLQNQLATLKSTDADYLQSAANKPVTENIKSTVDAMLGLQ